MDFIFLLTGLLTVVGAIAGLILACYLERRWLASKKPGPGKTLTPDLGPDGLST
jgi:hypothetical protein